LEPHIFLKGKIKECNFTFGVIKSTIGASILVIDGDNRTFMEKEEEYIKGNKIALQVLGSVKQRKKSLGYSKE
jgi:hypothetical protein